MTGKVTTGGVIKRKISQMGTKKSRKEETNQSEMDSKLEAELSAWSFEDGEHSGGTLRKAR